MKGHMILSVTILFATILGTIKKGQGCSREAGPSLKSATGWLNPQPLNLENLRGKVVLIDFWTYTCINWRRTRKVTDQRMYQLIRQQGSIADQEFQIEFSDPGIEVFDFTFR